MNTFKTPLPLLILLFLTLPTVAQAQFTYTTNTWDGTITITGYECSAGALAIPETINGLPVTTIGDGLKGPFNGCTTLTSVTIPNSVTRISWGAFEGCKSLTSVTIPDSVASIGDDSFNSSGLSSATIGNSVTNIGVHAFSDTRLGSVTIPASVANIGDGAFLNCEILRSAYFRGNAPGLIGSGVFDSTQVIVYYLPGTSGWDANFDFPSTALWVLPNPLILNNGSSIGAQTNGFGFTISWATNRSVVVEASTSLTNPTWSPIATNALVGGSYNFSDPQSKKYPTRFYRLRSL